MTDSDLSMANFRLLSENTRLRDIIEAADIQMGRLRAEREHYREAIAFLYNKWAYFEGEGCPREAVFGDKELDDYLVSIGEPPPERASEEVKAVVREVMR